MGYPKVLVSRSESQVKELKRDLEKQGFEVVSMPLIKTEIRKDLTELKAVLDQLDIYDWLVFTSANAVQFFFQAAEGYGTKFYFYPKLKIATVGDKTKLTLEQMGYRTNFVPIEYTAEVLANNMDDLNGKNILIPRSSIAKNSYVQIMKAKGAKVKAIDLYHTSAVNYSSDYFLKILSKQINYITFTSPSAVEAFELNKRHSGVELVCEKIVCIGPTTAKAAEELGFRVAAIANPHTVEGIVESIKKLESHVQTA